MSGRQIVLDTETTGLNPKLGDRVIELGCVEILSRSISERHFHVYLNPQREVEEGALKVHGLTREFLADKPRFADIARAFLDFIQGAELIIHHADFDVEFLDLELGLARLGRLGEHVAKITDTLAFARELHPGKRNTLDALCERYFVDHSNRTLHGALLDARLLAECYLAMTRGQESLVIDLAVPALAATAAAGTKALPPVRVLEPSADELAAHREYLAVVDREAKGRCVWLALDEQRGSIGLNGCA